MKQALSTNPALSDAISYFSGLPRYTLSAVQAAWDKTQSDRFTDRGIFNSLCKDFNHVGHELPKFNVFEEWASGARKGEVQRPQSPIPTPDRKAKLFAPAQEASVALEELPALPPTSEVVSADVSIEMFATRLFDDAFASLEREARVKAAEIVATKLRQIADRYAALAA